MEDNKLSSEQFPMLDWFDTVLWFFRHGYITATQGIALIYLGSVAGKDGRGHVDFSEMAFRLNKDESTCRQYFRRPTRNGLIERLGPDGSGGALFELLVPITDSIDGPSRRDSSELVANQHPADSKSASKCSAA